MKSNQLFRFTLSCITGICLVSRMGHAESDAAAVREAYGKLPLSFEANRGQMVRADGGAATNARGQSNDARPSMRGQEAIKELKRTGGYESLMEAMQAVYQKDRQAEDFFAPDATQQQKLTASDGAAGDLFGHSVAISGDTAIVGALSDDTTGGTNAGSAYVFTRSGTVWTQQQKLTASDGAAGDSFGRSVAINGDTAIVGATGDYPLSADTGWAYVFTRSGTVWTQQQKLTASDGEAGDQFGFSVAISGDTTIVGAYFDDTTGGMDAGSAYIFAGNSPTSQLLNISTRMRVLTDPNQLIGGFIITGTEPKRVIILATGPSLSAFGIPGVLANPTLELFQDNTLLASNDDWKIPAQAEIEATGLQPTNDLESALVRTLAPGSYTAIVRGTNGGTGVGTVQVFDLAQTANSKLANISSRGFVDTGANVMIAGFILGGGNGATNSRVLIRAIGPSLNPFLSGALQDPTLELKDANGTTLRSNDDWKLDGQQAEIEAAGLAPTDDRESALVTSLPSGSFTATVRGKSGATGVAVVQVYNVP